jgi:hypothetical protein
MATLRGRRDLLKTGHAIGSGLVVGFRVPARLRGVAWARGAGVFASSRRPSIDPTAS